MAVEECPVHLLAAGDFCVPSSAAWRSGACTEDQDTQLLLCAIFHFVMPVYEQNLMKLHSKGHLNIRNVQMKT